MNDIAGAIIVGIFVIGMVIVLAGDTIIDIIREIKKK